MIRYLLMVSVFCTGLLLGGCYGNKFELHLDPEHFMAYRLNKLTGSTWVAYRSDSTWTLMKEEESK